MVKEVLTDLFADFYTLRKKLEKEVYGDIYGSCCYYNTKNDYQIIWARKEDKHYYYLEKYREKSEKRDLIRCEAFDTISERDEVVGRLKNDMCLTFGSRE